MGCEDRTAEAIIDILYELVKLVKEQCQVIDAIAAELGLLDTESGAETEPEEEEDPPFDPDEPFAKRALSAGYA